MTYMESMHVTPDDLEALAAAMSCQIEMYGTPQFISPNGIKYIASLPNVQEACS